MASIYQVRIALFKIHVFQCAFLWIFRHFLWFLQIWANFKILYRSEFWIFFDETEIFCTWHNSLQLSQFINPYLHQKGTKVGFFKILNYAKNIHFCACWVHNIIWDNIFEGSSWKKAHWGKKQLFSRMDFSFDFWYNRW